LKVSATAKPTAERREEERALALAETLGAQLERMKGAGPKIGQFLSMLQLGGSSGAAAGLPAPVAAAQAEGDAVPS
jgi:hypothetical protein